MILPGTPIFLITYADHRNALLSAWEESAQKWGWKYHILGLDGKWESLGTLLRRMADYLETLDPNMMVATTDGFDVIVNNSPEKTLEMYQQYNVPIVIGRQTTCSFNCWGDVAKVHDPDGLGKVESRFLNTGVMMGKAGVLAKAFREGDAMYKHDDQYAMHMVWMKHYDLIRPDYNQAVVVNLEMGWPLEGTAKRRDRLDRQIQWNTSLDAYVLTENPHTQPAFLHFYYVYSDGCYRCNTIARHVLDRDVIDIPACRAGLHKYIHSRAMHPLIMPYWIGVTVLLVLLIAGVVLLVTLVKRRRKV